MAGITDRAFRSFMKEQGASIVVTELVSAKGILFAGEKTLKLTEFSEDQHPVGVQLFGECAPSIAEAAKVVEAGGADFIDLNFGCPVKKVVKKGAGSAVLKDLGQLREILRAVKSAITIPLTIKIRTGWDEETRNAEQVCQVAFDEGVTWVAIHGRTRAAGYSGLADWDYIAEVKKSSPLPVLGNGDVVSPEMAKKRLQQTGCDGIMIGRGCLKNPFLFREAYQSWSSEGEKKSLPKDYPEIIERLASHYQEHYDERLVKIQMKKYCAWFSSGFPGSAEFRKRIYSSDDLPEVMGAADHYFTELQSTLKLDTSHEAFLMGGHG